MKQSIESHHLKSVTSVCEPASKEESQGLGFWVLVASLSFFCGSDFDVKFLALHLFTLPTLLQNTKLSTLIHYLCMTLALFQYIPNKLFALARINKIG